MTYRHGNNEVGLPLLETKAFGYNEGSEVGDDGLDDKDDRDYGEISQLLSSQLRGKLGKDCIEELAWLTMGVQCARCNAPILCTH